MPTLVYIPEILEEHFEEAAFLLHLRAAQVGSGRMLYRQFMDLDERIEGHLQGLAAVPDGAAEMAMSHLGSKDPLMLGAAIVTLMTLNYTAAFEKCVALLAGPETMPMALSALELRCSPGMSGGLKSLAQNGAAPLAAVAAMTVQAAHFPREVNSHELGKVLAHADAPVRAAAWGAAQHLSEPRTPMQYRAGGADAAPQVRDAALTAAAWAGQSTVLDACRPLTKAPIPASMVPLRLFAILAPPTDAPTLTQLASPANSPLGPARFDLLAASGLPTTIPPLLAAMRDADAAVAAAAADAFERLTNFQPPAKGVKALTPPGAEPDAVEKEFVPEVNIPDPDAAARYWASVEPTLGKCIRIARGMAVDPAPADDVLLELDCAARDAVLLRRAATPEGKTFARWGARWSFPQRAGR
ncbi:MAG TPA: hypothetical protein VHM90_13965 [Phycisphaerae bacterium]|nr:hypothetical protein [Phycisphaerae bacterium]